MEESAANVVFMVLTIMTTVGLFLSAMLIVLLTREYRGRWNGEVYTFSPSIGVPGKLDGVVRLSLTEEIHGFRLFNVLPGKLPLVEVWENYDSFRQRPLAFRLSACRASDCPHVDVSLVHRVSQPPDAPAHSVTLKVWPSELGDAAEFEFQWQPTNVLVS